MTDDVPNPHDAFFKHYLSQPDVAVDFLRQHLAGEVLDLLDLSQIQLEKDSFVDEKLRGHFSDLIYRIATRFNTDLRIAFLYEHKSYPDEWVDFQSLRYQVGYWVQEFDKLNAKESDSEAVQEKATRSKKRQLLTPIVVVLVYHGKTEWQVELRFARHFSGMEDPASTLSTVLGHYVPDFEPHLINISGMADETIRGEVVTRLFVLTMKHIHEYGLGGYLDEILQLASEVFRQPSGTTMVMAQLRYIGRSAVKIDKSEMTQKLLTYLPKEGGVLMETMAQEWIQEGEAKGKKEGIDIGKKEGIQIGEARGKLIAQRQIMVQLLHHRFPILSEEEQKKYVAYLAQIDSLDTLTQLVNQLLTAETLAEFEQKLLGYLPKDEAQK